MLECIENMSKLHNDMRWIPVTERLPEDFVDVLVWFEYRCIEDNSLIKRIGISYTFKNKWTGTINGRTGWNKFNIIAWMPLPEPYKESEE